MSGENEGGGTFESAKVNAYWVDVKAIKRLGRELPSGEGGFVFGLEPRRVVLDDQAASDLPPGGKRDPGLMTTYYTITDAELSKLVAAYAEHVVDAIKDHNKQLHEAART